MVDWCVVDCFCFWGDVGAMLVVVFGFVFVCYYWLIFGTMLVRFEEEDDVCWSISESAPWVGKCLVPGLFANEVSHTKASAETPSRDQIEMSVAPSALANASLAASG